MSCGNSETHEQDHSDSEYLDVARAREVLAVLVEGDGHHAVGGVEGLLDTVTVVDVDVNVQHSVVAPGNQYEQRHDSAE